MPLTTEHGTPLAPTEESAVIANRLNDAASEAGVVSPDASLAAHSDPVTTEERGRIEVGEARGSVHSDEVRGSLATAARALVERFTPKANS